MPRNTDHPWYHKTTPFQGLVIDEITGDNIAVTYAHPHAAQIAREHNTHAALLEALQRLSATSAEYSRFMANKNGLAWAQYLGEMQRLDANVQEALQQARAAIAAATEE